MLANKTIRLAIATAAMFMLFATVEAAPTGEAAAVPACVVCDNPPQFCGRPCSPGYWCDVNYCTCKALCRKGPIP
ncbi:hypothetical protein BG000_001898 [Podila horticola]|nr:hypothetical protein BG003_010242 [Podila horticola]KAG0339536.1 hypothetical protein BG000_001898 [Podila horticola]